MYTEIYESIKKELLLTLHDEKNSLTIIKSDFDCSRPIYELRSPKKELIFRIHNQLINGVDKIVFEPEIPGLVLSEPMKSYIYTMFAEERTRRTLSEDAKNKINEEKTKEQKQFQIFKNYLDKFKVKTATENNK